MHAIILRRPLWAKTQELSLAALGSDAIKTVLTARLSDMCVECALSTACFIHLACASAVLVGFEISFVRSDSLNLYCPVQSFVGYDVHT